MNFRPLPIAVVVVLALAIAMPLAHAGQFMAAASGKATSMPVSKATSIKRPLLWKVYAADNSEKTVYLLGSFHLLKVDDYPLPGEVDRAFDDAESLLFEVDPREMTSPETMAAARKYMAYPPGKSLSTVLPKPTWRKLGKAMAARGGSAQAMEQSEPWAVSLSLILGVAQAMGFKAELGLDRNLMERAAKAGKPATGLETVDAQLKAMDSVPYSEQAQGLDEFLDKPMKVATQMQDLHAWWRSGDIAKLDSEMRVEMATKTPMTYKLLDVDRNAAWLPLIEQRLTGTRQDDTLIVVGSLHLLGKDGLVEKLRAKGYKVERICDTCEAAKANSKH